MSDEWCEIEEVDPRAKVTSTMGPFSYDYAKRFVGFFKKKGPSVLRIVRVHADGRREVVS